MEFMPKFVENNVWIVIKCLFCLFLGQIVHCCHHRWQPSPKTCVLCLYTKPWIRTCSKVEYITIATLELYDKCCMKYRTCLGINLYVSLLFPKVERLKFVIHPAQITLATSNMSGWIGGRGKIIGTNLHVNNTLKCLNGVPSTRKIKKCQGKKICSGKSHPYIQVLVYWLQYNHQPNTCDGIEAKLTL